MNHSTSVNRNYYTHLVNQVLTAMLKNQPLNPTPSTSQPQWTSDSVSQVLNSIPRFFFQSSRSIGRQSGFRHRAPLKQRHLRQEVYNFHNEILVLGPAAHRDLNKVNLGVDKALEFYYWVETHFRFQHTERTCQEMSIVLAKGNRLKALWEFLKDMSNRDTDVPVVTTQSITCLMKCLGEEGLVNEALAVFYRIKQYHCKPDVYAYNTIINALCRVGNFKKARFLLEQMELPGFRCSPDIFTYTILIGSYCRYGMETGCRKATRRRLWEANHMFRNMLFRGFVPDVVTYNALINGCCKTNRIERALELFEDMRKRECVPNRVTYDSFIRYYAAVNEIDNAIDMLRRMQKMNHGVAGSSSYTPIIHALCEAGRVVEAWDFLVELVDGGSIPREYTYKLVCNALNSAGEVNLLDDGLHKRIEDGMQSRYQHIMKVKPIMTRKGYDIACWKLNHFKESGYT